MYIIKSYDDYSPLKTRKSYTKNLYLQIINFQKQKNVEKKLSKKGKIAAVGDRAPGSLLGRARGLAWPV